MSKSNLLIFSSVIGFCALLVCGFTYQEEPKSDLDRLVGSQLHEFFDRQGNVIGVGYVKAIDNEQVIFVDELEVQYREKISNLSRADQLFCKEIRKQLGAIEKSRKAAEKLTKQLESGKSKNQIRACGQIRKLGIAASKLLPTLKELIASSEEKEVAFESLIAFASVCEETEGNLKYVLQQGAAPDARLAPAVSENPQAFLLAVTRWQEQSIPYLKQVAFTGETKWTGLDDKELASKPVDLSTTAGDTNLKRRQACFALGNIEVVSTPILLQTLASAKQTVNGKKDLETVAVILAALGNAGHRPPEVMEVFKTYKASFPSLVSSAIAETNERFKARQEAGRLRHGARMRYYKDREEKVFFRGELLSTENSNAIFWDRELKRVSIPYKKFSNRDQDLIRERFPTINQK